MVELTASDDKIQLSLLMMRLKNLFLLLCKVGLGGRRTKEWFLGKPAKIKLFLGLSNMRM